MRQVKFLPHYQLDYTTFSDVQTDWSDLRALDNIRTFNMRWQASLKGKIKPVLFRNEPRLRRIKFGLGKGTAFLLDRRSQLQFEFGLSESELTRHYRAQIRPTSILYDIGAADGDTAVRLASLVPHGHVFAFEADQNICHEMQHNLDRNPELGRLVEVLNVFVSSRETADRDSSERSIDGLVDRGVIPTPNFVKIDVDGGELDVLKGMHKTLRRCLQLRSLSLLVEVHSPELEVDCTRFLRELGYHVEAVRNAWWRVIWPELRPIGHNRWITAGPAR